MTPQYFFKFIWDFINAIADNFDFDNFAKSNFLTN